MEKKKILEFQNISKSFVGVKALSDVSFSVREGEVHALLGENGAGKSTLMKILSGAYMKDAGKVFLDGQEIQVKNTKESERLGISIIETGEQDGTVLCEELIQSADRVLVDGPCSGLGVIRRKPEIKYREIEDEGRELAEKQLNILENASEYVKKEGFLLYSTCTVNKIENAEVVSKFLRKHKKFELVRSRQLLPGVDETDGFFICKMRRRGS